MFKKVVLTFIAGVLCLTGLSLQVFAATSSSEGSAAYLSNNGYPVTVPFQRINGWAAPCANFDSIFPSVEEYEDIGNPLNDDILAGIGYYGFEGVDRSLAQKYNLSYFQEWYGYGMAVWRRLKEMNYPGNETQTGFYNLEANGSLDAATSQRLIDYINELSTKRVPKQSTFELNFDGNIDLGKDQVTSAISLSDNIAYKVQVPTGVTVLDKNGNSKTSFAAGEPFKLSVPGNYKGEVTASVVTEKRDFMMLEVKAKNPIYQTVLRQYIPDPIQLYKPITLTFTGSYDDIKVTKSTVGATKLLPNTTYEGSLVQDFSSDVIELVTDTDGVLVFEDAMLPDETYYIREKSAPVYSEYEGYLPSTEVSELTGIGGETQTLDFENEVITGRIDLHKTDETGKPLSNVEFELRTEAGKIIDKRVTDANGRISFDDLLLGKYTLIEDVPVGFTGRALVYHIDVRIDETIVTQGYNTDPDYEPVAEITVINDRIPTTPVTELPNTGEPTTDLLLIGIATIGIAGVLITISLYTRRVNKKMGKAHE